MVKYEHEELYRADSVDKQLKIATDDNQTVITNTEIESEQFELSESLCSESQLHFGACEASSVTFKIHNIFASMKEKWITITETLEGNTDTPFQFGRYKVFSDVPTADRRYRNVKAYDAMYDIINADVADWYNEVLPEKDSTITLKDFRTSFIDHFGLQQRDIELINDDMVIEKTVNPSQLSGKNVITAICEINACFGHIDREGKFAYIYLPQMIQGLYPANDLYPDHAPDYLPYQQETGHLYPQNPKGTSIGANGTYISCQYEDWLVKGIKKLQIREKENDIGVVYPDKELQENENSYVIQDNFLVYGKSTEQLKPIAEKIYNQINGIIYRPYDAEVQGNPCLEVGDPIRMSTRYEIIESYILSRTLKGVQGLRDSFSAEGEEYYNEKVNSVQNSIIQLRGKSNTLERTIEETKSTITDVEKGLQTQITQNAESITSEAKRAQTKEEELNGTITRTEETLSSKIEQTAESISAEVDRATKKETEIGNTLTKTEETLSSKIDQTASNITQSVDKQIQETKDYADGKIEETQTTLSSKIDQTAENITLEVSETYETKDDAGTNYQSLSSRIEQTVKSITIEVSEDGKTAGITVTMEDGETKEATGKIDLSGLVTFHDLENAGETTINGSNITTGTINADLIKSGTISGRAINGGTITGSTITGNTISGGTISGTTITGSSASFTTGFDLNIKIPFSKFYWTLNTDVIHGITMGFFSSDTNAEYSKLNLSQGQATLTALTGVTIDGQRGPVKISSNSGYVEMSDTTITKLTVPEITGDTNIAAKLSVDDNMAVYGSLFGKQMGDGGSDTTQASANVHVGSEGKLSKVTGSARRFKEKFSDDLSDKEINPNGLYDVDITSYQYKQSYFHNTEDVRYGKQLIGMIADDVLEKFPIGADYHLDENGNKIADDWNFRFIIPAMLKLIQDQKKEIDSLKESVSFLMDKVNEMEERLK